MASVSSFTALATVSNIISSLPFASAIYHKSANLGAVSVLLLSVSVLAISDIVPVAFGNVNVLFEVANEEKSNFQYNELPHFQKS